MSALDDWITARIAQSKNEILEDMCDGRVPVDARDFSTLHSHVDANEYGGLCDDDVRATFPQPARTDDGDGPSEAWMDAGSAVQTAVHEWLVAGGAAAALDAG